MTRWILNELSLQRQFSDPQKFIEALRALLKARNSNDTLRASLHITPDIAQRPVCVNHNFREAVNRVATATEKQQVLMWIAKHGPFWTTDRPAIENDLFYSGEDDVTDTGLGEAARRRLTSEDTETMSFAGANAVFDANSITLTQGLLSNPIERIQVPNVTDLSMLEAACAAMPSVPANWTASLDFLKNRYPDVWFSPNLSDFLDGQPFVPYVHDRAVELIGILNRIASSRNTQGAFSGIGKHLYATHFAGEKAWFTDESNKNKTDFKEKMSFFRESGIKEMCPFHGKIKTPQYRIHFPWPLATGNPVEIVYFGPKITKT